MITRMRLGKPVGRAPQGEMFNLIDVHDEQGNAVRKTKYYSQIRGEEAPSAAITGEAISFRVKPGESI